MWGALAEGTSEGCDGWRGRREMGDCMRGGVQCGFRWNLIL